MNGGFAHISHLQNTQTQALLDRHEPLRSKLSTGILRHDCSTIGLKFSNLDTDSLVPSNEQPQIPWTHTNRIRVLGLQCFKAQAQHILKWLESCPGCELEPAGRSVRHLAEGSMCPPRWRTHATLTALTLQVAAAMRSRFLSGQPGCAARGHGSTNARITSPPLSCCAAPTSQPIDKSYNPVNQLSRLS